MSRQFDEITDNSYELYGEMYSLVNPSNIDEFTEALKVRDTLQTAISAVQHYEDSSTLDEALVKEEEYIAYYIDKLGEFDNRNLVANINFLTKKNSIRIGELEKFLKLSAGYISRAANENSAKRLSIDVVWKIAQLFEIPLRQLVETDLRIPQNTTDLIKQFIAKIYKKTVESEIKWSMHGGCMLELNDIYKELNLFEEYEEGMYYHPKDHLNSAIKWELFGDIMAIENFNGNKHLAVIPFFHEDDNHTWMHYDFIFVWKDKKGSHWEKVFYSSDDSYKVLDEYSKQLYEHVAELEFKADITPEIRAFIGDYLKNN